MRAVRRPLLVLHPDAAFRARVRRAGEEEYEYHDVADWESLVEAVETTPPAALIVVDPYARANGNKVLSPLLRTLLAQFPSLAVVAALEVTPSRFEDVRVLGQWGVVQVIALDHDDTQQAVARRLRAARGRPLQALLEQTLPADASGRARAIIEAAADIVAVGGHGRDLARELFLSRRTLLRWCKRAGLPPPRTLLAWMRVLQAAELLDDPGRSVLSVAHICGYSSDSGLRRITQKFLGASPSAMREQGAFKLAARAFLAVFDESRKQEAREAH
ncbi:MAG TPA: helix-turn-helix domain-containing protein [Longimicrobiaceae bacterium]|jgi:AraC-like DNA-binding protein|nr:helix-turn-helix domain-containing protein [Longimicrobiaceae bacterium]